VIGAEEIGVVPEAEAAPKGESQRDAEPEHQEPAQSVPITHWPAPISSTPWLSCLPFPLAVPLKGGRAQVPEQGMASPTGVEDLQILETSARASARVVPARTYGRPASLPEPECQKICGDDEIDFEGSYAAAGG